MYGIRTQRHPLPLIFLSFVYNMLVFNNRFTFVESERTTFYDLLLAGVRIVCMYRL